MKNLIIGICILIPSFLVGQRQGSGEIRINGYTNYVFDDGFETFNSDVSFYDGTINGGFQWGVGLEFLPRPVMGVELLYLRQDTKVPVNYYNLFATSKVIDASVNYIMLGGVRYANPSPKVQGYGGFMLGTVIYDNKNPEVNEPNSITKFAWGLRLGADIWVTPKVGFKIQAQMISAVQAFGGSFYIGTGGTAGGVSGFSTLYQFGLGGGLTLRLSQ